MTTKHEITPDALEAAARAIAKSYSEEHYLENDHEQYANEFWECFIADAKAAITAFLEHRTKKGQGDEHM